MYYYYFSFCSSQLFWHHFRSHKMSRQRDSLWTADVCLYIMGDLSVVNYVEKNYQSS